MHPDLQAWVATDSSVHTGRYSALLCLQAIRAKYVREGAWQAHEGLQRPGLRFLAVLSADLLLSMPGYQEDLALVLGQVGTLALPRKHSPNPNHSWPLDVCPYSQRSLYAAPAQLDMRVHTVSVHGARPGVLWSQPCGAQVPEATQKLLVTRTQDAATRALGQSMLRDAATVQLQQQAAAATPAKVLQRYVLPCTRWADTTAFTLLAWPCCLPQPRALCSM